MAHDVFISYSADDELTALAVCAKLEERSIRCWIARRDLRPGDDWPPQVLDAIVECRVVVLVFSEHASASPQVRREIMNAFEEGKTVIPFRIQAAEMPRTLRLYMRNIHWLDALTPPIEKHILTLATEVAHRLHSPSDTDAEARPVMADVVIADARSKIAELEDSNRKLSAQLTKQQSQSRLTRNIVTIVAAVMIAVMGLGSYVMYKPGKPQQIATPSVSLPLSAPIDVHTDVAEGKIKLAWTASTGGAGTIRYQVWRSSTNGTPSRIDTTTKTTFADSVDPGTYSYFVTALDAAGRVSAPSNKSFATKQGVDPRPKQRVDPRFSAF
jgi:hypothetical protein